MLRIVDGEHYTCAEVKAVTLNHLADIRGKLADLKKLEKVLKKLAAQWPGTRRLIAQLSKRYLNAELKAGSEHTILVKCSPPALAAHPNRKSLPRSDISVVFPRP